MDKFIERLKEKGLKLVEKTNKVVNDTKEKIKKTLLDDQLKRRFQLENPRKFIISDKNPNLNLINELTSSHAKVYEDDLVFVFYGHQVDDLKKGAYIKDLSNFQLYRIESVVEVEIPVTHQDQLYDVPGTAVYCEEV